jgi:hypothetical protein
MKIITATMPTAAAPIEAARLPVVPRPERREICARA